MTMSDHTAATTLSVGSSGPVGHARSSIGSGSASQRRGERTSSSRSSGGKRDSIGGGGATSRRTSLSRADNNSAVSSGSSAKLTAMARMEQRGGGGINNNNTSSSGSMSATTANAGNSITSMTGGGIDNNASFDMRHSHYKEGIRLAEMGDWPILVRRLPREPQLARHKDHHGMLPLHWACTEDDAGPMVVHALLEAFPEGVITRNNAQYLPIHIAVRAGLPIETLQLLCDARPSSLLEETPAGKTPLMLAIDSNLPAATVNLLRRAQQNYEDPSEDNDDDRNIADAKREIEVQSHLLRESMMLSSSTSIGLMRSHSKNGSTLSVGRLQSNSVLGNFPAEARSSVSWSDRHGRELSSTQSFSGTTNTTTTSNRSFHQQLSSASSISSATTSQPHNQGGAVVRYMDTLMSRDKNATTMIDEETEMNGRYTVDEDEYLPPRGHSSLGPLDVGGLGNNQHQQNNNNNGGTNSRSSSLPRPTHLRATEGDLSNFNSGVCGVCYKKFSMFRKKYQCKSCWMVVCKKHVAAKVELPGHAKKRSVCADCFILHRDGTNVLPSVPGHHSHGSVSTAHTSTFPHTHNGTYNVSSALVPTRGNRSDSTPGGPKPLTNQPGGNRPSATSNAGDLRHTMATVPSRTSNVRFAPTNNSTALVQKPLPTAMQQRSVLDNMGSDMTASMTETDRSSAEVVALHHRVGTLEEQNKLLLSRLAEQEKQYDDCMLLLTQTMTRVAEIEMRMPNLRIGATGSERESEADPASFDFGYPLSAAYGMK